MSELPFSRRAVARRRFIKDLAASAATYSVFVAVDDSASSTAASREEISKQFDHVAPPQPAGERLAHEPNMTVVNLTCDFMVAGGGMAGVCAAVAAARHGMRVVLVQDRSRLGGNSSSEVKMHIVGADIHGQRPGWREGGLLEEFRLDDAVLNPQRSREMWDLLLYDKVKSEPNIALLLDTSVYAVEVKESLVQLVFARCDKTEHIYRIKAGLFADCTGDCRLGLEAGADMRRGREAKSDFNEPLAIDKADDGTLGSSILFTARDYGRPMRFTPPAWARKITKEMLRFRPIHSWEYGYWWIEWGGAIDTIRDNERIRFELLAIVLGVWDYIKNSGAHPSSENWAMDWLGMISGKRGSRRMLGDHILTQHDLLGKTGEFYDAVAIGGWGMDDHPPGGFDRHDLKPFNVVHTPFPYNIPLRALHSRNIRNLFMAGRNISATHVAFTSIRVMATCAVMGQAVGTAAAFCKEHELLPRELSGNKQRVKELQQILLRDDQTIRGLRNEDALDLARSAEVTASGSLPDAEPNHVINGYVRDLPKQWNNRWAVPMDARSRAAEGGLQDKAVWLQLEWKQPQTLRQVQLTFDTGFHRELTHSQQASKYPAIIWGAQPETVRDYELLYRPGGSKEWKTLGKYAGNYQRLRRHQFEPFSAIALRVKISATNGEHHGRIYEVRCYA